jgi:hypothetical protein
MTKDKKIAEDLKQYITECEEAYYKALKTDSCSNIMNCYYELKRAQRNYYVSIGRISLPEEKEEPSDFV